MILDREKHIKEKLQEHYDEATSLGYEIFCVVLQGSQNYNLDIYSDEYQSDVDTKAIVLPSFEDFCRGYSPLSTTHVRASNEHIDLKDIRAIFETFKKQNINFVEILFSKYYIVPEKYAKYWEQLHCLGEQLTHCHPAQALKAMAGLSYEKHKALCHPYPSIVDKIKKYGYDGKQLHHILRINTFMKNYIAGVPFEKCLTSRTEQELMQCVEAKLNKFSLETAKKMASKIDEENRQLKDDYINVHGTEIVDTSPYEQLEVIKTSVLRQWFKEQLS